MLARSSSRAIFLASLVSCVALAPALRAESGKRAFALPDLYRLKGVGDVVLSPDGRTVVFGVTSSDITKVKRTVNLWRMDPDGKNARPITFSDARDEAPAFSPDGSTLAFVSSRSGDPQLYLLPLAGGEPRKATDFPGGVGSPVWSPSGRQIALTADVWPECGADAECNKKLNGPHESGKLKAHLADGLLYRHWTSWQEGTRSHILLLDLAKNDALRDLTPGDFDSPDFSLGGPADFAFSPDGKELAFTSKRVKDPESQTNTDIYAVNVSGTDEELGNPRDLTQKNASYDGQPRYSPDGKWIAFRMQATPGYESDRFRIALLDRKSGAIRSITESFDNWVTGFWFGKDGSKIYFTGDVKGRTPLHELDLASGNIRVLTETGLLDAVAISPDGTWAVVARRRIGTPSELWRIAFGQKPDEGTRLTTFNADVEKEVDIRPAEEITVPGADGHPVQVFLVKPHGFDPSKKYPLILNVHGGPQQQWADAFRGDWQVYPGAGYVVAFPNPHGSTGFGQAYTAAISGDWKGKVIEDVMKVADDLALLSYVDKDRMGAMGWSWGGYAMMWLEGHTTRFKVLASMMGVYDLRSMYGSTEEIWFPTWDLKGAPWENPTLYKETSPSEYVTAFKTPCLVLTGEKDYRVPYTQSLEFFTDLQKRGVPSRLIVFEKAGHWPSWSEMALYYAAHLDWFHRWLGGAPSPWDPKEMVKRAAPAPEAGK